MQHASEFPPLLNKHGGRKQTTQRCGCCPTVLGDDDVGVGAAVLVDVLHSLLDAVHHLHAALQVAVLGPQGLGLRRAEGQVGGESRASVDLYLRSSTTLGGGRSPSTSSGGSRG